ncbi:M48 family metallopeptidase [Thioalkalivibrio sulfidiphilus]|uniref:M48 family metallopeptidase n=1 Tax=Thioalkalivibrio sulfidiphilus TaxID=1033854 RepID=UPI003B2EF6BD
MNFFQHQDRARRQSRRLVLLFALAVLGIVLLVNLVALLLFGRFQHPDESMLSAGFLQRHLGVIVWSTALSGGLIALGSLFRMVNLRAGGGVVARELGGTLVEPDTNDPLRRRLRNVVEEMAIASGVPVPEIYVLEHESGINAFAAGYSTADAAVAVTRGTLEHLDRDELQGVIAHEFSHILNGDMRLNIRLMGILFGILVMAMIGRQLMASVRYVSTRRSKDNSGVAAIVILGLAVMLVGYVGLFFARWIKAMVSRQREYLADASAVQFTRQSEGIAGALKKIGAAGAGSVINANSEEVAHMLFANGAMGQMFATHPPLVERIRAIEPGFDPEELKTIRAQMQRHAQARRAAAEEEAAREAAGQGRAAGPGGLPLDADSLIEQMGQPGMGQVLAAALLVAAIPRPLERAAHSPEWAPELICYLLLDPDEAIREHQLLMVAETLGAESEAQVRKLLHMEPRVAPELRIPLLEIAFPAIRRRPESEREDLRGLVERIIHADGRVDVFEYALARLLTRHLDDAAHPSRARPGGRRDLSALRAQAMDLLGIVAGHGHPDNPDQALAALNAGLAVLDFASVPRMPSTETWPDRLDAALERLDELQPQAKEQLLRGLVATITHGGQTVTAEAELLRAICAALHMPLPIGAFEAGEGGESN